MNRKHIGRSLWIAGVAMILLSAVRIIPPTIGWIGFGIAVSGNLIGWGKVLVSTSEIFRSPNQRE